jgi:hypothetical protein
MSRARRGIGPLAGEADDGDRREEKEIIQEIAKKFRG